MNWCGLRISQRNSAACPLPTDVDISAGISASRLCLSVEISSHWNCSGRLTCQLDNQVRGRINCSQDTDRCAQGIVCVHRLKGSKRSIQSVPAVFPIELSSWFRDWVSQLFKKDVKQDKESEAAAFESFVVEYEIEEGSDLLHTYMMKPGHLALHSEDSSEDTLTAQALAEVAITDLFTAIPSINALHIVPYFDILQNNLTQAPKNTQMLWERTSSTSCPEKAKPGSASSDQHVSPDQLGSPDALASWLSARLPSGVSQWGTAPGTKRVANLWIELIEGEILLEDAYPPKRTVHVASVKIKNKAGQMLVEAHQEMADGSIRERNRPLSEKMRPGENVEEACFRGIFEELGSQLGAKNRVRILLDSYRRKEEERESSSYPGLLTSYVIHSVDATVENLPDTGFYTIEDEVVGHGSPKPCDGATIGVKKHFWRWIPQPS